MAQEAEDMAVEREMHREEVAQRDFLYLKKFRLMLQTFTSARNYMARAV